MQVQTVAENLHCNIDAFMGGGSAIASLMLLTVTFKAGFSYTKFLERMRSTRERSYSTMANTGYRRQSKVCDTKKRIKGDKNSQDRHARVIHC